MDDATVTVRVPAELAFLLRPRDRPARERRLGFDADATVGHVVRAAGVPLTEVGALWLDGGEGVQPGAVLLAVEPARGHAGTVAD